MPNSLATLEKFAVSHKFKQNYHTTQQSKSYVFTQMEQKLMLTQNLIWECCTDLINNHPTLETT